MKNLHELHMASMDNVGRDHRKIISGRLLKVVLMECAVGIWFPLTWIFALQKTLGYKSMDFFMVSSKKWGVMVT